MFWLRFHLKVAYSTEIGASTAYRGHSAATSDPDVAAHIAFIETEELRHRARVGEMMEALDARPFIVLEWLFLAIGTVVGLGCYVWGEWASAFGAAQFEVGGVGDYRRAAKAARRVDREDLAVELDAMEQDEADHRAFFLALARSRFPFGARPTLDLASYRPEEAGTNS
ncbi:MAG: demethoxyubiquinone hydroxylase family protein [Proteobacteria bacterium]|nr:demethoxyubiquinone hydroxylase family protein [Pseudomonadota bacterium]